MSDETGKADWFAMSTEILEDDKLEILRERHGNDALAVVIKLMCKAKLQRKGGVAKVNLRSLASDAHVDRPVAKAILEDAAEVGFLEVQELTEVSATVQLKGWNRWQQNFRQQKSREARKATTDADVTGGHDLSHDVTNSTRQDKTEQNKKKKAAPQDLPPDFPADLVVAVDSTLPVLQSIAEARGAKPVTRLALAKVIEQYPRHAHLKVARSLDHWLLHGGGEKKPCKDVVARYRNFLDREEPVAVTRPTVQQSVGDRMEVELPDIPRTQIDMHIYRLQQQKRPVTAELIRERHLAANPERTAA